MSVKLDVLDLNLKDLCEPGSLSKFFESCFKMVKDIQIWSPSKEILRQEWTLVSNALTVYMAMRVSMKHDRLPQFAQIERLTCQSLDRVFQCMSKSTKLSSSNAWRQQSIAELMQKVLEAIKDPIIHFQSLDILGPVVTMCGLICLLVRMQWPNKKIVQQTLSIFREITNLLCKDSLQESVPYKNGYLESMLSGAQSENDFPCVQDFVNTVFCPCPGYATDYRVVYKPWQWLDIICLCREYVKKGDYFTAMKHLEDLLDKQLDPEIRSLVLCLFAECYLQKGCSQLALQTCKAAMKADKNNHRVFFYLADVYKKLKQDDLELESLNMLVKLLTDKHLRSETLIPDVHLDALVFCLSDVLPTVNLPGALHHFAKRCSELHRYTEASEQYMILLKLLEEDLEYSFSNSIQGVYRLFDVQEVIVEAVEALAQTRQAGLCLRLFDQFFPILMSDDSVFLSTSSAVASNSSCSSMNDSQDSLFCSQHHHYSGSFTNDKKTGEKADGGTDNLPFKNLCDLTRRKYLTSECLSVDMADKGNKNGSMQEQRDEQNIVQDPWWPSSLAVRLLVSKADVLIPSQGYSDEVMSCLNRAQDLLLKDQIPIFKQLPSCDSTSEETKSLPHKRRRVTFDQSEATSACSSSSVHPNIGKTVTIANQYEVSDLWRRTMMKVAERMQKAYQNSGKHSSASNVSKLLHQLAPDKTSSSADDP